MCPNSLLTKPPAPVTTSSGCDQPSDLWVIKPCGGTTRDESTNSSSHDYEIAEHLSPALGARSQTVSFSSSTKSVTF